MTNRQLFLRHVAQTSTAPLSLEIARAEGMYMHASDGKKYLDLIAGISVSNLGHSHPAVVDAVKAQAEKYMHLMVYGEFVESPQVKFAQEICALLPSSLNNVYFTNSGAEATEGAMKLAKRLTGRRKFVSFKHSYHGSTQGALSLMGDETWKRNFRPLLPEVEQYAYNSLEDLEKINCRTAAVFVEPVQAETGVTVPHPEFIQKLRQKCDEVGALLVFDEAQTGFGRTGKMFAMQHFGVVPDILLLAKALGGGMPLGAFISSQERMSALTENPVLGHITTFGGHPVSCAAGVAALETMLNEKLIDAVEAKGQLFERLLASHSTHRIGLMMSIDFGSFERNKKIIDKCIEHGVLTDWFLFAPQRMRIAPPLIISEQQITEACTVINEAAKECNE